MQVIIGPINIRDVISYDVSMSADGGSNRYNFSVPYSRELIGALNELSTATKGILLPTAPQPTPPTQGSPVNPQVSMPSVQGMPGVTISSKGVPSFPIPADERVRVQCIIREAIRQGVTDTNQIAYLLATAQHECGRLGKVNGKNGYFIPITEFGGPFRYDPYRGRGLVQLTWLFNYKRYQDLTGLPIVSDFTLMVRDMGLSCFVLVHGSKTGTFTGRKLSDYIGPGRVDFIGARRIINGTDKAALIAGFAQQWVRKLPSYMGGLNSMPSVAVTQTPVTVTQTPVTDNRPATDSAAGTPEGKITAPVIFQLPGDKEAITGFYAGYKVNPGTGMIDIEAVGYRKASELIGNPLIVTPGQGTTVSESNGASLIYIKDSERRRFFLGDILEISQNDSPVSSLTIIKDGLVKGNQATVTVPESDIKVGDFVQSDYLSPPGDYIVDAITRRDNGLMNLTLYRTMEADVRVAPPPVINIPQGDASSPITGAVAGPVNPGAPILQRMVSTALSNVGKPSGRGHSPPATNNGRLACAWSVTMFVLRPVFGRDFGSNILAVISVEAGLKAAGWKQSPSIPGAIAVATREPTGGGHIGIIVGPNDDSLSNSSSRAAWVSRYPWRATMGRTYAPARIRYWVPPNA